MGAQFLEVAGDHAGERFLVDPVIGPLLLDREHRVERVENPGDLQPRDVPVVIEDRLGLEIDPDMGMRTGGSAGQEKPGHKRQNAQNFRSFSHPTSPRG